MATLECPFEKRLRSLLPTPYPSIRREPVLKEDELAAWPYDSTDTLNGLHGTGNRAQGESANHRIYAAVRKRNPFSGQIQKLYIQLSSTPLLFCTGDHPRIRPAANASGFLLVSSSKTPRIETPLAQRVCPRRFRSRLATIRPEHLSIHFPDARFWIAVVPGGKGASFCRSRSNAFKSEHPPVLYRARLFLPDESVARYPTFS